MTKKHTKQVRGRGEKFQFFHLDPKPGLTEILSSTTELKIFQLPEPAVFVTTKEWILWWIPRLGIFHETNTLYLYGVVVPEDADMDEGLEGMNYGDWMVFTDQPLPATFLRRIEISAH